MGRSYNGKLQFVAFMLAMVMVIPMLLTGCDKKSKLNWDGTENDYELLKVDVSKSDNHYNVTLSSEDEVFVKDVSTDAIKINAAYRKETDNAEKDENSQESDEYIDDEITSFNVGRDSATKLTITFDSATDYTMLLLGVHKSAMENGKYGEAYWVEGSTEEIVNYSAEIDGTFNTYDKNPAIKLKLENTACADSLTADMFTLDGAFKDLVITGVAGNGYDVTLTTEGKVNDLTSHGKVTLKTEATNCGEALEALTTVKPVGASVVSESYKLENGMFEFRVELGNITFTGDKTALESAISADGMTVGVKEVGDNYAVLNITTDAADVDAALDFFGGKTFIIAGSAFSTGEDVNLIIGATKAEVNFVVDYISKDGEKYKADALLYTLYGDMGDITKDDITLGGGFEGAVIESVTKNDNCYDITFTFSAPYADFNSEDCELNGTLTVTADKVKNVWGTNGICTCSYSYVYNDDMNKDAGETIDSIADFISAHEESLSKIGTTASVVSGVSSAVSGVNKVLQIFGVVESTDSKLDNLKKAITVVSSQISELRTKMDNLNDSITNCIADVSDKVDKNTYINVCNYWNTYMGTYVGNLNDVMDNFENDYQAFVISFLNDPANTEIKIFIDSDGKVALTGVSEKYSTDGKEIAQTYICKGNEPEVKKLVSSMLSKGTFASNRRELFNDFCEDIENGFAMYDLLIDTKTGKPISRSTLTSSQLYSAFTTYCARLALDKGGTQNILNAYTAFCYRLGGGGDTSDTGVKAGMSYIDDFYTMISLYYNFYSEAENDIKLMRDYLKSVCTKARRLALFAQEYTTKTNTVSEATAAFNKTIDKKAPGEGVELPDNRTDDDQKETYSFVAQYSFVANRRIYVRYHSDTYDTEWHEWYSSEYNTNQDEGINATQMKLIYNRYNVLKNANVTKADNFFDYLGGNKLRKDGFSSRNRRIFTEIKHSSFLPDGSLELNAYTIKWANEYVGDYFKNKALNKIDCSGKRESKYYKNLERVDVTCIDDKGKIATSLVYASGSYYEEHFYWSVQERWQLSRIFDDGRGISLNYY